jgi:hypothetical protein
MLALASVLLSFGQTAKPDGAGRRPPLLSPAAVLAPVEAKTEAQTSTEIFREIEDPNSGARWLLSRDLSHPGGPGVLAPGGKSPSRTQRSETGVRPAEAVAVPIIRSGDMLVLEEHSAVADARLQSIALGPAAAGSALRVRLTIGGKVVWARALAAGRVVLESETGGRP